MMNNRILILAILFLYFFLSTACRHSPSSPPSTYKPLEPTYSSIHLAQQSDTLNFPLPPDINNSIKSFNFFSAADGTSYISFYDAISQSIAIYDFNTKKPIKKIQLKKALKTPHFYKPSVFVKNVDSIYVTNFDKLYLLDTTGKKKRKITFNSLEALAYYETPVPVITKNNSIIMGVRPFVSEKRLDDIKDWKVLCAFNFKKQTAEGYYPLPPIYHKGLYGRRFMEFSYCYNDKGNFVFSFPADTNIYETDLNDYHIAYYAKSRQQQGPIETVSLEALKRDEGGKEYALRDSYGSIYYDPYRKRYLRIAKQKVTKEAYESKTARRTTSIIIFDEDFKIIGECPYTGDYDLDTIFFIPDGGIYARVNKRDEYALHFIRLAWSDGDTTQHHIAKKNP